MDVRRWSLLIPPVLALELLLAGLLATGLPAPAPAASEATEASALTSARQSGQLVEVLGLRTESTQTFATPQGSFVSEESLRPRFVHLPDGWRDADATLRRTPDGGIEPVATTLAMRFSGGGDAAMATLAERSGARRSLSLTWPATLPEPVLEGPTARYRDVLPGVDLEIRADVDAFTHLLVIRSPEAAANPALRGIRLGVRGTGVSLRRNDATGAVAAVDATGAEVFGGPSPSMWDSRDAAAPKQADAPPVEPRRAGVGVRVEANAMTLVPDAAMLTSRDVTWPLVIDPTWSKTTGARSAWTVLRKSEPSRSFYNASSVGSNDSTRGVVRAGFNNWEGPSYTDRSLFNMNVSGVRYKHIYKATFSITQGWAGAGCGYTGSTTVNLRVLNQSFGSGTVWNTGWNTGGSGWGATIASTSAIRRYGDTCAPRRVEFNVTSRVTQLAAAGSSAMYLGLRAASESNKYAWKRYKLDAVVSIEYNTKPNAPTTLKVAGKACAVGAGRPYATVATPNFTGYAKDPDVVQQALRTRFYWWRSGLARGGDYVEASSANPGNPTSPAIPAAKSLLDGQTYVWQAQTLDDVNDNQWSGTCEFTVDLTDPAPSPGVTSTEYPVYNGDPNSPGYGGVGAAGTFRVAASASTDAAQFAYTFDVAVPKESAPRVALKADRTADILYTPTAAKLYTLRVWTVDKAGRYSTARDYQFKVKLGNGPAAKWSYEDSANLGADSSGQTNTLTMGTSGITTTPGRSGVGTALALNGTATAYATRGAVTYPHPTTGVATPVAPSQRITVSAWVKLTATGGPFRAIASYNGSRMHGVRLGYDGTGNRWAWRTVSSDVDNSAGSSLYGTSTPVAGVWTHLTGTYDVATHVSQIYVNGQLQAGGTVGNGPHAAAGSWDIGRSKVNGVFIDAWSGAIDDVRVYGYAAAAADFAEQARPYPPTVSFPSATEVSVGGSVQVRFETGVDKHVTGFRYSVNDASLNQSVTATANGDATVTVTAPATGELRVFAAAVYGGYASLQSLPSSSGIPVTGLPSISGVVTDTTTGALAAGSIVTLDPGGYTTTANASGAYAMTGIPAGNYTIAASLGAQCPRTYQTEIAISGTTELHLFLTASTDRFGYSCVPDAGLPFQPANTSVLPLTGDNAVTSVTLPFAFPFYGNNRTSAWVDTNGILTFDDPQGSKPVTDNIPAPALPNAMVAPFWDDLVVDASASVRTATVGSTPTRQFIVEWRNVYRAAAPTQRVTFEAVLDEQGLIFFQYASLDNANEQGDQATVGIESPGGEIGVEYAYQLPVLANGRAVAFVPPVAPNAIQTFAVSGNVTDADTGAPAAGVSVKLEPAGRTATTNASGAYSFANLEIGSYTVFASAGARCAKVDAFDVYVTGASTSNLALRPLTDDFGYSCSEGSQPWTTLTSYGQPNHGDNASFPVTPPFAVKLYGASYGAGWINTNGVISFVDPGTPAGTDFSEIPSPAAPGRFNAAVYPFWADLNADAQATIHHQTYGTAPNRTWIVEWRNMAFVANPSARVSFEVVFAEGGDVTMVYKDIDPASTLERGATATVGIEDITGTTAYQYAYNETRLATGNSLHFRVLPQAPGSVAGAVTCEGAPVAGATVRVGGLSATTAADGGYSLPSVAAGPYSAIATLTGSCKGSATVPIQVSGGKEAVATFARTTTPAGAGYTVVEQPGSWITQHDAMVWIGTQVDEGAASWSFPFPVSLYGQTYTNGWIHSNGFVSFAGSHADSRFPGSLPSPATATEPNAALYPLWRDWIVVNGAIVSTGTTGIAPNRSFVVTWTGVAFKENWNITTSFQIVFYESGGYAFNYGTPTGMSTNLGGDATIGIENADGTQALQYTYRHPALRPNTSLRFFPPTS
jgi:hypothetical protein